MTGVNQRGGDSMHELACALCSEGGFMQVRGEVKGKRATGGEHTQEQGRRKRSEPGEEESRQSQVKAGRPRAGESGEDQGR